MDDDSRALSAIRGGFLATADLHALGWSTAAITHLERTHVLVRFRHAAYAFADTWRRLSEDEKYRITGRAVVHRHQGRVALCAESALLERGVDVWNIDRSLVHVQRLDGGTGRREAGVRHHVGASGADGVEWVDGVPLVRPSLSLWQAMCGNPIEQATVMTDSALFKQVVSELALDDEMEVGAWRPGARRGGLVRRLCDPLAETVGETRSRHLFYEQRIPRPRLQVEIRDHLGRLLGRADMGWDEQKHLAEFDGRVKYGRLLKEGESASDVVFAEKRREDALRREGWGMSRLTWADLAPANRVETARRVFEDLQLSARVAARRRAG